MSIQVNNVFGSAATTRVSFWLRRVLIVLGFPTVTVLVIFGALAAARDQNILGTVGLIATGVLFVPAFIFVAGREQRLVTACWKAARASGASSVYVFSKGWRTVDGREETLSPGWIGVQDHEVTVTAGRENAAAQMLRIPANGVVVRRKTVLSGLAFSQLEVQAQDVEVRLELVNAKRPLFSFLSDMEIDDAVSEIKAEITHHI